MNRVLLCFLILISCACGYSAEYNKREIRCTALTRRDQAKHKDVSLSDYRTIPWVDYQYQHQLRCNRNRGRFRSRREKTRCYL